MLKNTDINENGMYLSTEESMTACSCCCHGGHNHDSRVLKWYKSRDFREIMLGAILFAVAVFIPEYKLLFLAVAYIILGRNVLYNAFRNILKGQVFNENFLMSIATLGAMAIAEYPEAVGVMLFFRIGEFFEERATGKSRQQIIKAIDMRPESILLLNGDEIVSVPATQARIGDVILVRPGDRIPLDGIIVEGSSQLDTSPLTGEIMPVNVTEGRAVLSGCINKSGVIKIRVDKPLSQSMVSRILSAVQSAAADKPHIQRFINRFARIYTPVVTGAALLIAIVPPLATGQWHAYIYAALTFLVISCPCALVLSVPLAFFSGIGTASRQGILFKDGAALEALAQVKVAALDKTGTLTQGVFAIQQIKSKNGFSQADILRICAALERTSAHPIAVSIVKKAEKEQLTIPKAVEVEESPSKGMTAVINGKKIICGNQRFMNENNIIIEKAMGTTIYLAVEEKYAGCIVMGDTLKGDALLAVNRLRKQAIKPALLTGDSTESAVITAETLNIKEIYTGLLPEDKLKILQKLRGKHGKILFTGDGINDAPVLANADVGAAMGSGSDAAIEAADIVFMTSKVESIADAVDIAKTTRNIAMQNVILALGIKSAVMVMGLLGHASLWSAVFADTGAAVLCIMNSIRFLYLPNKWRQWKLMA
ncbi:heavy metal translocating P-type ATPase [Pectinatus sottacetonis]|uniref:heavy metal translocating P-type ATPase n=1 Tax=Pectinatus sottacetonis TaxID=1002795 RepID=UPI0018C4BFE4